MSLTGSGTESNTLRRANHAALLRRLWIAIGYALVVAVVWLSLTPSPPQIQLDPANWSGHAIAYAAMMAWFACVHASSGTRMRIALALCALGILLECLQALSGWRTFDPLDMLANATGVAIGWLAAPPRMPNPLLALERMFAERRASN